MTYADRDRLLHTLGYASYFEYLNSPLWASIRLRVMGRGLWVCRLCRGRATQVHHLSYSLPVLLGHSLTQLVPLCNGCHERVEYAGTRKRTLAEARRAYGLLWARAKGKYALHMARLRFPRKKRKKR